MQLPLGARTCSVESGLECTDETTLEGWMVVGMDGMEGSATLFILFYGGGEI